MFSCSVTAGMETRVDNTQLHGDMERLKHYLPMMDDSAGVYR